MPRSAVCAASLALMLAGCGSQPPPPPPPPAPPQKTVFDDLVSKKQTLPAKLEDATRQHMDAINAGDADAARDAGTKP